MIVLESEMQGALGLTAPTDLQRVRLKLAMDIGHAAVRRFLKYDPEQKVGPAEIYPRRELTGPTSAGGFYDINSGHTKAIWTDSGDLFKFLQLQRLPIRKMVSVLVDPSAKYGQQTGDFGSGTEWTVGEEYFVEWDEQQSTNIGISRSGMLIATGAWPSGIGTVKVTYRAGYSDNEFRGPATTSAEGADGTITTLGVDASGIKSAALLTCMAKYLTLKSFSVNTLTGVHPVGPFSSERLGDYSWSGANPQLAAVIAGMATDVPPEAAMLLSDFVSYADLVL
jgi:hypothetical protein